MKRYSLFLLPLFAIWFSCGTNTTESEAETPETAVETTPEPKTNEPGEGAPKDYPPEGTDYEFKGMYSFEGVLNGNIPVHLWYYVKDNIAKGEITYKKVGEPIRLYGQFEYGYLRLKEFGKDGNVTGIISCFDPTDMKWFSPVTRVNYDFDVKPTEMKPKAPQMEATGDIVGTYAYQNGEEGHTGTLIVHSVKDKKIKYDLFCLTQAPARNMATVEEAEDDLLDGNRILIDWKGEEEFEDCSFEILFKDGFAAIRYIDERRECMFGHNAHVDGVFAKIK